MELDDFFSAADVSGGYLAGDVECGNIADASKKKLIADFSERLSRGDRSKAISLLYEALSVIQSRARYKISTNPTGQVQRAHFAMDQSATTYDWPDPQIFPAGCLAGKKIVFTGFSEADKIKIKQICDHVGAELMVAVGCRMDYLITGVNAGPAKIKKAKDLGKSILEVANFVEVLKNADKMSEVWG